jgi:hypothetical protein
MILFTSNSLIGLIEKVEASSASPQEKREAKGILRRSLENPTVAAVLGSAVSGVLALLG